MMVQWTLAIIKPDVVAGKKVGEVITMIEQAGFEIHAMQTQRFTKAQAEAFYGEHGGKSFFEELTEFMSLGRCIPMVLTREDAIVEFRKLIGNTNPEKAEEGTIRKIYGSSGPANAIHGSDSMASATREIRFFFPDFPLLQRSQL